jgi:hypothetical protein
MSRKEKEDRTMRTLKVIGVAMLILVSVLPLYAYANTLGDARLSLVDGDIQIKPEESQDWIPASINMPLREGDSIWVPDGGRAEVQLLGGSQVRLDENTSLDILNLDRNSSQFYLAEGSAYVNFPGGRNSLVQIDTPLSSVRAYDRAAFGVDVSWNGDTDVSVFRGVVDAESRSGRTRVASGRILSIGEGYADLAPLGRPDDWGRWNMARDERYAERRYSSRYLPEELEGYASDFDDNGRWVYAREYGYVWTPTVAVSVGWSPYRHGRWAWIGGDYVWVGYEPWGWAPYHYGRWSFIVSIGWCWVPPVRGAVYWGPGFVGWVSNPGYVAWVPLAPGEIYHGYGHYGPHSVNIVNVDVRRTTVINTVYKNVYVNNAVTVVHHDTFVKGRKVDHQVKENPFLRDKIHVGRPDIKPERETRMPVVKEIPRTKEPPQKIRDVKVRELKEKRRLAKGRRDSAFAAGAQDRQLKVTEVRESRERKPTKTEKGIEFERRARPAETREPAVKERKPRPQEKQQPAKRAPKVKEQSDKEMRERPAGRPAGKAPVAEQPVRKKQQVDRIPENRRGREETRPGRPVAKEPKEPAEVRPQRGNKVEPAGRPAGKAPVAEQPVRKKQQVDRIPENQRGREEMRPGRPVAKEPKEPAEVRPPGGNKVEPAGRPAEKAPERQEKRKPVWEQQDEERERGEGRSLDAPEQGGRGDR